MIYRLTAIDEQHEMRWTEYATAMLLYSGVSMVLLYFIERLQKWLPLNPQKFANVDPGLAFGTAASFTTNTNWQAYSGESAMSLSFRSIQIADREIPIPMSIVSVKKPAWHNNGTSRHDIKLEEGQILEEKADVKGYVLDAAIGTGGGSLAGLVFSHVVRGFGLGMAGSAIYILERKGKDVSLPPETGLIVRLDSQLLLPTAAATADVPAPAPVAAPIGPDSK